MAYFVLTNYIIARFLPLCKEFSQILSKKAEKKRHLLTEMALLFFN